MLGDYLAKQRALSASMGLYDSNSGLPTQAGLLDAARQYGGSILMGNEGVARSYRDALARPGFGGKPYDSSDPAMRAVLDVYGFNNGDTVAAGMTASHVAHDPDRGDHPDIVSVTLVRVVGPDS